MLQSNDQRVTRFRTVDEYRSGHRVDARTIIVVEDTGSTRGSDLARRGIIDLEGQGIARRDGSHRRDRIVPDAVVMMGMDRRVAEPLGAHALLLRRARARSHIRGRRATSARLH